MTQTAFAEPKAPDPNRQLSLRRLIHLTVEARAMMLDGASIGPALDAVQVLRPQGTADGIQDLPFRDLLAAAYDLAIGRLFPDQRLIRLSGKGLGVQNALAGRVKGWVFL